MTKKYPFTQYGAIYGLVALIPFFPVMAVIPSVAFVYGLEVLGTTCEIGYLAALLLSSVIAFLVVFFYLRHLPSTLQKNTKTIVLSFGLWSALLYLMASTIAFILFVGVDTACHGDGQTGLAVFFSAPFASISLVVFGILVDVKRKNLLEMPSNNLFK